MSNSGFETSQPPPGWQPLLLSSCFLCLGEMWVGSIRLAWGAFAATSGDTHGTAAHSFRQLPTKPALDHVAGTPWGKQTGRKNGSVEGKTAVGEKENDLDAGKRSAWGPVAVHRNPGSRLACAGLACSCLLFWEGIQEFGVVSASRFPLMDWRQVLESLARNVTHPGAHVTPITGTAV